MPPAADRDAATLGEDDVSTAWTELPGFPDAVRRRTGGGLRRCRRRYIAAADEERRDTPGVISGVPEASVSGGRTRPRGTAWHIDAPHAGPHRRHVGQFATCRRRPAVRVRSADLDELFAPRSPRRRSDATAAWSSECPDAVPWSGPDCELRETRRSSPRRSRLTAILPKDTDAVVRRHARRRPTAEEGAAFCWPLAAALAWELVAGGFDPIGPPP